MIFSFIFWGGGLADRALTFTIQTSAPPFKICHLYFFLKRQCYAWIWYKFSPIIPPLTWKIQSFHIYYLYCFWATRFVRNVLFIWYVRLFSLVGGGACRVLITLVLTLVCKVCGYATFSCTSLLTYFRMPEYVFRFDLTYLVLCAYYTVFDTWYVKYAGFPPPNPPLLTSASTLRPTFSYHFISIFFDFSLNF